MPHAAQIVLWGLVIGTVVALILRLGIHPPAGPTTWPVAIRWGFAVAVVVAVALLVITGSN